MRSSMDGLKADNEQMSGQLAAAEQQVIQTNDDTQSIL